MWEERSDVTRTTLVSVLVAAIVVLGSLGSPLVTPATAETENVTIQDGSGTVIDTANAGQTVYVQANVSGVSGTDETAVVNATSGDSISITLQDTDNSDGEYEGSFTVSASSTSDTDDQLRLDNGETAEVSVDLDDQGDNGTATVTADYGPSPTGATTLDTDENGTVDAVSVTFDEPVDSVSYSTGDFTVENASVSSIASNDGDDTLRLELSSVTANDTALRPDVTVAQNAVQDTSGYTGPVGSAETVTASDGAAPIALNASYRDTNTDGTVDRVDVRYSEDVSASSSYANDDWSIPQNGSVDIEKNNSGDISTDEVRIDVTGTANTTGGATPPEIDYAGTSVTDGVNDAPAQTLTVQDGAAPTFAGVETVDANENGKVDALNVTFTEDVASGSVEAGDFSIASSNGLSGSLSGVAGDNGNSTVTLSVSEGGDTDTGATPAIAYAADGTTDVRDADGNIMADATADPADDGAAPQLTSVSATGGSGTVTQILVAYSEDVTASSPEVGDYTLGGADAENVTLDSASTSSPDNRVSIDVTAPANDTALDLTLSYERTNGTDDSVVDDASNPAASFDSQTASDTTFPWVASVTTNDTNRDGAVDELIVEFTEPVDDSTVDTNSFDLTSRTLDGVDSDTSNDDKVTLSVSGFATDTSASTTVLVNPGELNDLAGNPNAYQEVSTTDGAAPVITAATTADGNDDGTVDRIDVTLSEPIDDGASTLDASAFSLSAGSVDSVDTGTADDDSLQLTVSGLSGSDATPDVTLSTGAIVDPSGNALTGSSQTFTGTTSGAAPAVQSVTTLDRDGNGTVDAATVTFSGAINDSTVSAGDWTIGGETVDSVDTLSTADDDRLQLRLTGTGVNGTGTAEVTYTPGSTADGSGNLVAAVDAGDVSEADGATPVVTNVSATTIDDPTRVQVEVTATESLSDVSVDLGGPESATLSSFAVSGDGPYVHTLTYEPSSEGQYTATVQTAADGAGNDGASGQQDSTGVSLPASGDSGGGSSAPSAPGSLSSRVSSSTVTVFGGTGDVTFDLGSGTVSRVEVSSDASGAGFARATTLDSTPEGVSTPDDRTVGVVSVQMPDDWATTPATLRMSVDTSATDVDPEQLQVSHYDESTDSWDTLDTSVDSRSGGTVVLSAETPGFSTFAVVEGEPAASTTVEVTMATPDGSDETASTEGDDTSAAEDETSATEDDTAAAGTTAAAEPAGTTTSGDGAGFGVLAALTGLVTLLALARRQG